MSENKLLTEHQSGFRPKHSCETALHNIIDKWLENIDKGKLTGVIFIDLSKAFDTVNHDVLLHKLLSFGICENTFKWFQSYLHARSQCVKWKGVISEGKDVTIGVPQGSILGPLFFILFVNDYPKCLKHSTVNIYADDTTQDVSDKSLDVIEKKLQDDLLNSIEWMQKNKLTINLKKTQCMLIGTSQKLLKCRKLCVNVGENFLENVNCAKLLGVYIDECLAWSHHTDVLCKKLSQKLGVLRRLSNFMSKEALLKIYNTIVFPHFNYCCTVWHDARNKTNITRLFKLQKRAARIILDIRVPQSVSTFNMLSSLRWMPMPDYFIYRKIILIFKVLHCMTPEYLSVFRFVNEVSTRNTRQSVSNFIYVTKARTEYFKRSFIISAAILWNSLPDFIRECRTLTSFRSAYVKHYFNTR